MNLLKKFKNHFSNILKDYDVFYNNLAKRFKFLNFKQQYKPQENVIIYNDEYLKTSLVELKQKNKINHITLCDSIKLLEHIKDKSLKKEAETFYIDIIMNKDYLKEISITELSQIYYYLYFIDSIIQKDIDELGQVYMKKHNDILVERYEHILILDSLYFLEKKGFDVEKLKQCNIDIIFNYFETFNNSEIFNLLVALLFMKDNDIRKLLSKVITYFDNKILNIKKDPNMNTSSRIFILQFYPRLLKECLDEKLNKQQISKIVNFLNASVIDNSDVEPFICLVANLCHFLEYRIDILEKASKLIKPNVYDLKEEIILEFLFTVLQANPKYKISQYLQDVLRDIVIVFSNLKYSQLIDLSGTRKDFMYSKVNKEKILKAFQNWSEIRNKLELDKKYLETFTLLVNSSLDKIPFTMIDISEEKFDIMFENFKKWVRL